MKKAPIFLTLLLLLQCCAPISHIAPAATTTLVSTPERFGFTSNFEITWNKKVYDVPIGVDPEEIHLLWHGDYDNDGINEYFLENSHAGIGCHTNIFVIDYDIQKDEYRVFDEWSATCANVNWEDISNDGRPEIVTRDEFFSSHYRGLPEATFAASPIKILQYENHRLTDVTREYPTSVYQDANFLLSRATSKDEHYGLLFLDAYIADMYLIGMKDEGIKNYLKICSQGSSDVECQTFLNDILKSIHEAGYDH